MSFSGDPVKKNNFLSYPPYYKIKTKYSKTFFDGYSSNDRNTKNPISYSFPDNYLAACM